jgi:hypothetical protein
MLYALRGFWKIQTSDSDIQVFTIVGDFIAHRHHKIVLALLRTPSTHRIRINPQRRRLLPTLRHLRNRQLYPHHGRRRVIIIIGFGRVSSVLQSIIVAFENLEHPGLLIELREDSEQDVAYDSADDAAQQEDVSQPVVVRE